VALPAQSLPALKDGLLALLAAALFGARTPLVQPLGAGTAAGGRQWALSRKPSSEG